MSTIATSRVPRRKYKKGEKPDELLPMKARVKAALTVMRREMGSKIADCVQTNEDMTAKYRSAKVFFETHARVKWSTESSFGKKGFVMIFFIEDTAQISPANMWDIICLSNLNKDENDKEYARHVVMFVMNAPLHRERHLHWIEQINEEAVGRLTPFVANWDEVHRIARKYKRHQLAEDGDDDDEAVDSEAEREIAAERRALEKKARTKEGKRIKEERSVANFAARKQVHEQLLAASAHLIPDHYKRPRLDPSLSPDEIEAEVNGESLGSSDSVTSPSDDDDDESAGDEGDDAASDDSEDDEGDDDDDVVPDALPDVPADDDDDDDDDDDAE